VYLGEEVEVLIISFTCAGNDTDVGHSADKHRINVSLTQAHCQVVLVCHSMTLRNLPATQQNLLLRQMIAHFSKPEKAKQVYLTEANYSQESLFSMP